MRCLSAPPPPTTFFLKSPLPPLPSLTTLSLTISTWPWLHPLMDMRRADGTGDLCILDGSRRLSFISYNHFWIKTQKKTQGMKYTPYLLWLLEFFCQMRHGGSNQIVSLCLSLLVSVSVCVGSWRNSCIAAIMWIIPSSLSTGSRCTQKSKSVARI